MRRGLEGESGQAEMLSLLGELGEFARQSLPAPAPQGETQTAANAPNAPALAGTAHAPVAPAPPELQVRPEYRAALRDSELIHALLELLPETPPKKVTVASVRTGFESSRPPQIEIEPKPLGRGRGVFKPKNDR